jgi:hypothetical protein
MTPKRVAARVRFPTAGYPAEKTFPTFVPYAEQLLATLQLS